MENNDRLDEFMRGKFAADKPGERFAFREEHWLQAQALIDNNARRKRWFFWWRFGLGLGLVLLGLWWFWPGNESAKHQPNAAIETTSASGEAGMGEPGQGSNGTLAETAPDTQLQNDQFAEQTNSPKIRSTSEPASTERIPKKTRKIQGAATRKTTFNPVTPSDAQALPSTTDKGDAESMEAGSPSKAPADEPVKQPISINTATKNPTPKLPESLESTAPLLKGMDLLPTTLHLLPGSKPKIASPKPVATTPTEPVRNWRWQLGVQAGAGTALGHLQSENPGLSAGLTARLHRRGSAFSWNTGLVWRWRRGGIADSFNLAPVEQLRYSFGYTLDVFERQATATHWLEWPICLQYHRGPISASAGLMPMLLLSINGEQQHIQSASLAPDPVVFNRRDVQIENTYFTQFNGSLFAGLQWQATDRLELGLQLHVQPSIWKNETDATDPQERRFWGDLTLRYFIKK